MQTTTGWVTKPLVSTDFTTIPNGTFRVSYAPKKSRTIEFLDELYTYPPKFRVKWDTIDELHEDLFMSYNYRLHDQRVPFIDSIENFFTNSEFEPVKKTAYAFNSYLDGYLNKITSTRFYGKNAKYLQQALQSVPVYTILNGQGEVILATSTDSLSSTTTSPSGFAYDFCGSFDPVIERENQLGLFFLSRKDAEVYLNEIAKVDTQGTKRFGLSIHCFGLDFAYRVTREYHPNVDFRFIPDLTQVQTLMSSGMTGNSALMFEDGQQQLRFRNRKVNIIPIFNVVNKWISPFSSFLEKTEYYKGVPIYLVNVNSVPTNFVIERYHNVVNFVGNFYGRIINSLGIGFGLGNNWILQGSLSDQKISSKVQTYVFFDQVQATKFCQDYTRKIDRYNGNRTVLFDAFSKKPKIVAYNLEDFLEVWEESLAITKGETISGNASIGLDFNTVKFISSKDSQIDLFNYSEHETQPPLKKVLQFFDFKYRRLRGFFEILLNTN